MIRKKKIRKNPNIDDTCIWLFALAIHNGRASFLVDALIYYRQGDECKDCDHDYSACECEYCEDCKYRKCLCDLDLDKISKYNSEIIISNKAWEIAKKIFTKEQFDKMNDEINNLIHTDSRN